MSGVFRHLSLAEIANLVGQAKCRAIVAAPGIDEDVAAALIGVARSIGVEKVQVILDVDEENCRAGYGNVDGYSMLVEAGIPIRRCPGLRIGFVLADDVGFIFGLPPLMVEAPMSLDGCPNAIRATPEQVDALEAATRPLSTDEAGPARNLSQTELPLEDSPAGPEIGVAWVENAEVERIQASLRKNPVPTFNLSRITQLFGEHLQFVEFRVEGANLEARTVQLPAEILTAVRDRETRKRLTAGFRVLSDRSMISSREIGREAYEIRKRYIRVNQVYGGVVLKSEMARLLSTIDHIRLAVEAHRSAVAQVFQHEMQQSKYQLVEACAQAIKSNPPRKLRRQLSSGKPDDEQARKYLLELLDRVFPSAKRICDRMVVTVVTKDLTWENLSDGRFVRWLAKKFPDNEVLKVAFQAYDAARGTWEGGPGATRAGFRPPQRLGARTN